MPGEPIGRAVNPNVAVLSGFMCHQDAETARAQFRSLEQDVLLQVWTSYYDLRTATQRLRTVEDLLKSAAESQEVALGRYQAGAGSSGPSRPCDSGKCGNAGYSRVAG